jgi:hypothetical protein
MKTKKISNLLEWILNEPRLVKVQDGFLYHNQFFTNKEIIKLYAKRG